ncbi:hypothetical protein CLU79DRAFT_743298 [Phycomyces nitens]|nr:hypothetical protein CLU79DRAFT_743298 [Phycomyces nitens]
MYHPTFWSDQDLGLSSDTSPSSTATIPLSPIITTPLGSHPFTHQPTYSDPTLNLLYSHYLTMETQPCSASWAPQPTFASLPSVHITPAPSAGPSYEYNEPLNSPPLSFPEISAPLSSFFYSESCQGPSPIMTRSLDIPVRSSKPPTKNAKQKGNARTRTHKRTKTSESLPSLPSTEARRIGAKCPQVGEDQTPGGPKNRSVDGLETELAFLRDETVSIVIVMDSLRNAFLASTSEDPLAEPNGPISILTASPEQPAHPSPMMMTGTGGSAAESFGRLTYTPDMDKEVQTAYDELSSQVKQLEKKVSKLEEQVKAHSSPGRLKRVHENMGDNQEGSSSMATSPTAPLASSKRHKPPLGNSGLGGSQPRRV